MAIVFLGFNCAYAHNIAVVHLLSIKFCAIAKKIVELAWVGTRQAGGREKSQAVMESKAAWM
jgi:hypothetical protein